jgi:hypothetical protein
MSTEQAAEAEAAAEARRQFEEARTVATEAWRSFLRGYLTKPGKAPAGTLQTAVEILYGFNAGGDTAWTAATLLGIERNARSALADAATRASENRLPLLVLA